MSNLLYRYFSKKVYILIDEYDHTVNNAYYEYEDIKKAKIVSRLYSNILTPAFKDNPYLEKGFLT